MVRSRRIIVPASIIVWEISSNSPFEPVQQTTWDGSQRLAASEANASTFPCLGPNKDLSVPKDELPASPGVYGIAPSFITDLYKVTAPQAFYRLASGGTRRHNSDDSGRCHPTDVGSSDFNSGLEASSSCESLVGRLPSFSRFDSTSSSSMRAPC